MTVEVTLLKNGTIYYKKDCKVLKTNWNGQKITPKTIEKQGKRWRLFQWFWFKIRT